MPFKALAKSIPGGWPNMVALGVLGGLLGLPLAALEAAVEKSTKKGGAALAAGLAAVRLGVAEADKLGAMFALDAAPAASARWLITGNEAAGFGALQGGVRFVAAYPITPATELLEWMAPALVKVGGALVQAEDELASINMILGASYGGVPSLTATSGPGLALMSESLGLGVAAEVPIVVVDVMRTGPSTGIATKTEQADLNIALYGLHGDAPHVVVAPNSVADCLAATQWAVELAESLQLPAIVLSDQYFGQARAIVERPRSAASKPARLLAQAGTADYKRYRVTDSGVSPMAIPGAAGIAYTADGLEHNEKGTPSSQPADHLAQLEKRNRKLDGAGLRGALGHHRRRWRARGPDLGILHGAGARGVRAGARGRRQGAPRFAAAARPGAARAPEGSAARGEADPGGRAEFQRPVPPLPARGVRPAGRGAQPAAAGAAAVQSRRNPPQAARMEPRMNAPAAAAR